MGRFVQATDTLMDYLSRFGAREHPTQVRCREETAGMGRISGMQIAPEQGPLLALLVQMLGAKNCLEIGTFTGYSAMWVASVLPPDGNLICCDVSEEYFPNDSSETSHSRLRVNRKVISSIEGNTKGVSVMPSTRTTPLVSSCTCS